MKHKKIAVSTALLAALLALTLVLLTGCSQAVYATVSPAWQTNTEYDEDFAETLTYSLSYTSSYEANDTGWRVEIDQANSYYTVTVTAEESYAATDGTRHWNVYHLHSELVISATYAYYYSDGTQREIVSFGGDSGTEPDRIVTDVWFHSLAAPSSNESQHSLEPIYSERTVLSHTPTSMTSDNVSWFSYTSAISYDAAGENATLTFTDNWGELSEEDRTVSDYVYKYSITSEPSEMSGLRNSYSAFDNEQLMFAGRGLTFAADTSHTVNAVSAAAGGAAVTLSCSEVADRPYSFNFNGQALSEQTIATCVVNFSRSGAGDNTGTTHTVDYANRSSNASANTYRNLPLRITTNLSYAMGSFLYVLTSANYTEPTA